MSVHFYRYKNDWMYRPKAAAVGKPIDTYALEKVLGVVGGPKVIVCRKHPTSPDHEYQITIENGFITKAELGEDFSNGMCFSEVFEFTIDEI